MKKFIAFLAFALLLSVVLSSRTAFAQGAGQADLLERAYSTDSYELLHQFFDNWHQELASNEAEAADPWLKEAYEVYAAVCQPEVLAQWHVSMSEKPFLIVQGDIWKVGYLQQNNRFFREGDIPYNLSFTVVDSAVAFRPMLQADSVVTVYLTDGYKQLVKDFFTTYHLPPLKFDLLNITEEDGDEEVIQPIGLSAESDEEVIRSDFLQKYVSDVTYWLAGAFQIRPFFSINEIVFSPSRRYAIVTYSIDHSGGTFVLEKKHGKWTFLRQTEWSMSF